MWLIFLGEEPLKIHPTLRSPVQTEPLLDEVELVLYHFGLGDTSTELWGRIIGCLISETKLLNPVGMDVEVIYTDTIFKISISINQLQFENREKIFSLQKLKKRSFSLEIYLRIRMRRT